MKRSTFLTMVAMMLAMFMVSMIPTRASVQQWNSTNCCTYTVDMQGVSANCLPFKLQTYWVNGANDNLPYFNNGVYVVPIPAGPAPCPPAPEFKGVSIDNGIVVGQNQTIKVKSSMGCCFWLSAGLDPGGCVYIKISPAPGPC